MIRSQTPFPGVTLWVAMLVVWFFERIQSYNAQLIATTNRITFMPASIASAVAAIGLIFLLEGPLETWAPVVAQACAQAILLAVVLPGGIRSFGRAGRRYALDSMLVAGILLICCVVFLLSGLPDWLLGLAQRHH